MGESVGVERGNAQNSSAEKRIIKKAHKEISIKTSQATD